MQRLKLSYEFAEQNMMIDTLSEMILKAPKSMDCMSKDELIEFDAACLSDLYFTFIFHC